MTVQGGPAEFSLDQLYFGYYSAPKVSIFKILESTLNTTVLMGLATKNVKFGYNGAKLEDIDKTKFG